MRPTVKVLDTAVNGSSLILVIAQNMLGEWKEVNVLKSLITF